jgi:energy coupling factor transporter S component ThiW
VIGTGIIGALVSYPVAVFLMGREVALFAFVVPFGISTITGSVISVSVIKFLERTHILDVINQ